MTDDSYLDEPIPLPSRGLRPTPAAIRAVTAATGRPFGDLLGDEGMRLQTIAFLELWKRAARLGCVPEPSILWAQADLCELLMEDDDPATELAGG